LSYCEIVINKLLDKYEKSLHAQGQGLSKRRVLLKIDRGDISEYDYHNVDIRDDFNESVRTLEVAGIVSTTWARKGILLSEVWLNLDNVEQAYKNIDRESQKQKCERFIRMFDELKSMCTTDWIKEFANDQISKMQSMRRLTSLCKRWNAEIDDIITALRTFEMLHGKSISMRAFSIKCFRNSKYFEQKVKDAFISIAEVYEPTLASYDDDIELGWREKLILLGIYARPELYELSGNIIIDLKSGCSDLSAFGAFGVALPDTVLDEIIDIQMEEIRKVIFIENKTCYDEYLMKFKEPDDLVFYHGGFISKKKAKLVEIINKCANEKTKFLFWGDIDIGGFRMFCRLAEIIPSLLPLKMGEKNVKEYHKTGLDRADDYFAKMNDLKSDSNFSLFFATIDECMSYSVTIEQESMLDSFT